jgi:DNA-binding response OmpR family regulator
VLSEERGRKLCNSKKKIMIVDDDETTLHMLKRYFIRNGFQVSAAKDGLDAMERLNIEKPDLVLTDIKMPSFSGADLINFIRNSMNDIPILVMTAYPYLYPKVKNGHRVDGYFQKPFDIDEMLSTIEKILGV